MTIRSHVYVAGNVQGVFFRATVAQAAQDRGVTGWVRNLSDGRVEAELQGDEDAVEAVLGVCREGSEPADVRDLETERIDVVEGESDFDVR